MKTVSERLFEIGEPYAAGFFENEDRSYFYRAAKAMRRYREHCALPVWSGESLYPVGPCRTEGYAVMPHYSRTHLVELDKLREKDAELAEYCRRGIPEWHSVDEGDAIFGGMYTHCTPHYERIMRQGLESYRERVLRARDPEFRDGCLEILDSIRIFRDRCLAYLRSVGAQGRLIEALERVPFAPARSLYEALVGWNFIYYIDLGDNIGCLDSTLDGWYRGEDVTDVIRDFFRNVDATNGWSLRVGPRIYPITYQILEACRGIRRPSVELCIDETVPEDIWALASDLIKCGSTNPSFYNYPLYQRRLAERFPSIPRCDLETFTGGGCSETMLTGISRVGSIDGGVNLAFAFCEYMNASLAEAESFDAFYGGARAHILGYIDRMYRRVADNYAYRAKHNPCPTRTLLVDDCIDNETDFNAGGARYNWSIVNFAGTINVIESLLAIREIVFERREMTGAEFLRLLNAEDALFYRRLAKCPHYGVSDPNADVLARDFYQWVFTSDRGRKLPFGLGFLTSSIQFTKYVLYGLPVGPTPDGRRRGEPLADSLSPILGNDRESMTSMLGSVTSLGLDAALGTPIVNLRLSKRYAAEMIRPMVQGYFEKGGMQLQINCLSREDMEDAMVHPEKHRDLIVRMGGYSEYFVNLSSVHQRTLIERTEHGEG